MFDSDTLTVTYDSSIGDRARPAQGKKTDYKAAVAGHLRRQRSLRAVCPHGIDIRNGLQ